MTVSATQLGLSTRGAAAFSVAIGVSVGCTAGEPSQSVVDEGPLSPDSSNPSEGTTLTDTLPPADTAAVDPNCPAPVAPDLGAGFVDVTPQAVRANIGWPDPFHNNKRTDFVAAVGDLNADGHPEVIFATSTRDGSNRPVYYPIYTWLNGAWIEFAPLNALWRDRTHADGPQPDLVPPARNVRQMAVLPLAGSGGGVPDLLLDGQLIRRNAANGVWQQTTTIWPTETSCGTLYATPFAIHILDVDNDGWLDVQLETSPGVYACSEEAWSTLFQVEPGRWAHRAVLAPGPSQSAYAYAAWWREPGGPAVISMMGGVHDGSSHPHGAYVQDGEDAQGYPTFRHMSTSGRQLTTLNPMGVAFIDLDGDGTPEHLFASTERQMGVEWSASGAWPSEGDWFDIAPLINLTHRRPGVSPHMDIPWATFPVDVDRDGLVDIIATHGDDFEFLHGLGYRYFLQAWRNPGTCAGAWQSFPEWMPTSPQDAFGSEVNERGMALWDLDADGDADLIIGGFYTGHPRVLRNEVDGGQGMTLQLHGTTSNPAGIGAEIEVTTPNGHRQRHQLGSAGSPNVTTHPIWSPGLAEHGGAEVVVRWPSGFVHEVGWLPAGAFHHIEEPPVLTVSPANRRVPRGEGNVVTATLCPYAPDAQTMRTDTLSSVTLRNYGASAVVTQATATAENCRQFTIVVGNNRGSFLIEGTFSSPQGATPLRVRPRVWVE